MAWKCECGSETVHVVRGDVRVSCDQCGREVEPGVSVDGVYTLDSAVRRREWRMFCLGGSLAMVAAFAAALTVLWWREA